jgi:hypothetical protein
MPAAPSLTPEETARLGKEIYERLVLPTVKSSDKGKVVAIDVKSRAWILDESGIPAAHKLRVEHPDAEVWLVRIGYAAYHHLGGQSRRLTRQSSSCVTARSHNERKA